ncbi:MAG TPA: hypothetical protein VHZ78_02870 [Rhizomicrobium sp.]|jgi:hypothetical protein|nr:hypothetical protein [Rhizomicrobium sp.]
MLKGIVRALAICGALLAVTPTIAAAPMADATVLAPLQQFADGMNAGDFKKAGAAYAASASIIDEFAPHHWNSFGDWLRDAGAFFKANGVTDLHIALGKATDTQIGAHEAYLVVPTVLTSKTHGKPTTEKGIFTFALVKGAAGWSIAGWAWTTL